MRLLLASPALRAPQRSCRQSWPAQPAPSRLQAVSSFPFSVLPLYSHLPRQQPADAFQWQMTVYTVVGASAPSPCPHQAQEPLGSDDRSQSVLCPETCQLEIVTDGSCLSSQMPEASHASPWPQSARCGSAKSIKETDNMEKPTANTVGAGGGIRESAE